MVGNTAASVERVKSCRMQMAVAHSKQAGHLAAKHARCMARPMLSDLCVWSTDKCRVSLSVASTSACQAIT